MPVQPCPRCGRNMFWSDVQNKWMHSEEEQDTACGWGQ